MMDFTLTGFDAGASEQQGFATARARYATDVLDGHQDQTRTGRRELEDHALLALHRPRKAGKMRINIDGDRFRDQRE